MKKNILLSIGKKKNKQALLEDIKKIPLSKFRLFATEHTSRFLKKHKIKNTLVYKVSQADRSPNLANYLTKKKFDLIINIPTRQSHQSGDSEYTDGQYIRKKAVENNTTLITSLEVAGLYFNSLAKDFKIEKPDKKRETPKSSAFTAYYHPLYDIEKSYDFNYEFGPFFNGPFPENQQKKKAKKQKRFLGFKLNSLFGVPAGPLLNANWVKCYSTLGFDILTYKTVRTINKACHQPPNIVFIDPDKDYNYDPTKPAYLKADRYDQQVLAYPRISITNSFGVPSKEPDVWQEDIRRLQLQLKKGQLLILSVMGTLGEETTEKEFVQDFVDCALLGKEAGVKVIEANLSCPNLGGGAIFNDISLSKKILENIKQALKKTPLLVKIGFLNELKELGRFVKATNKFVDGYVAINTVPKKVLRVNGEQVLPGKARIKSGTCGALIKEAGLATVKGLAKLRKKKNYSYKIIGVGGVMKPKDYFAYRQAGADAVQSATGAMWNPYLAYEIKKALEKRS